MKFQRPVPARAGCIVLVTALVLQGCASAPAPHRPAASALTPPTVQAPEEVIQMAPIPNPEPTHSHVHSHHATTVPKAPEQPDAAKPAPHPAPVTDHAKAAKLRAQGLEQLDRGQINRAVQLLEAASQLDPGNPLIQRDLDRAQRISKAVHARP